MKKLLIVPLLLGPAIALADGRQIIETQCIECHVIDGQGGEKKAAPPMYAVWHHYRQAYPQREEFVAALSAWLRQPNKEQSRMKGAMKKFGLMDRLEISESDARSVAEHLYASSYALPEWYVTHYNKNEKKMPLADGDKVQGEHSESSEY